jgi:hypothetical protein
MAARKPQARPRPKSKVEAKPALKLPAKPGVKNTIALIYDFDGTLSPRPMQEYTFLPQIGEDPATFWAEVNAFAKEHHADNLITYMHLMYKKAKAKGVRIDRADLVKQGATVELFQGVREWFQAISEYVQIAAESPVIVKHYLVSSGLQEIIEGTPIYPEFAAVFASEYFFEAYDLPYPKRVITDRRSICSASTRASRTSAAPSTATCPSPSGRSRSHRWSTSATATPMCRAWR